MDNVVAELQVWLWGNNVWRRWHDQKLPIFPLHEMVRTERVLSTCIFPALRALVSVGSGGCRCLDDFSENICYTNREREATWGGSTSVDFQDGILEKTALLQGEDLSKLFSFSASNRD